MSNKYPNFQNFITDTCVIRLNREMRESGGLKNGVVFARWAYHRALERLGNRERLMQFLKKKNPEYAQQIDDLAAEAYGGSENDRT